MVPAAEESAAVERRDLVVSGQSSYGRGAKIPCMPLSSSVTDSEHGSIIGFQDLNGSQLSTSILTTAAGEANLPPEPSIATSSELYPDARGRTENASQQDILPGEEKYL